MKTTSPGNFENSWKGCGWTDLFGNIHINNKFRLAFIHLILKVKYGLHYAMLR